MATGRVLQFDHTRGYGFVATNDGGEDVFLHASVFDGDDTLSPAEFSQELTELLLSDVPALTGQQIFAVRQSVLECAKKHGWVDI